MIFKLFNQYLTESNSASLVPINESKLTNDFRYTKNAPQSDEATNSSFSARYNMADPNPESETPTFTVQPTEEQAKNVIKQYVARMLSTYEEFQKDPMDTVVFIKINTLKKRKWINDRALFDADLYFKYADAFKSPAEIKKLGLKPVMQVKPRNPVAPPVDIWNITQINALRKGSTPSKISQNTEEEGENGENANNGNVSNGSGNSVDLGVAATTNLARFTEFNGLKQGQQSEVIRKLQKMIIAGAIAYPKDEKYKTAANTVKAHGGADSKYGSRTAETIGILIGTPAVTEITQEVVDKLAAALANVTTEQINAVGQTTKTTKTNKPTPKKKAW